MTKDTLFALLLVGMFASVAIRGWFCYAVLEFLMTLTRPGSTALLLGIVVFLYSQKLVYTTLIFAMLSIYLLTDVWTQWPSSDARQLYLDRSKDNARFEVSNSIDLAFARRTAIHDSPNMLQKDRDATPLLLYPPSDATLESMCG